MKRFKSVVRSLALGFVVIVAVAAFYAVSSYPQQVRDSKEQGDPGQSPRIQISDQPDSPLVIFSIKGDSATAHVPQVEVSVVNRSIRPIRAYTLRYQTISDHSKAGGTQLTSASSVDSLLQPGYTASITLGEGTSYTDPIVKIVVSIDFVELADGSTWGPDESKSSDRLAGQRAGAHQAVEQLVNILHRDGPLAVMQHVEANTSEVIPPLGHSPEWRNGFEGGVGAMKVRLKAAYSKSGIAAVESELRRPFDASDVR